MMMRMMVSMSSTMLMLCSKTVSMRTQLVVSAALTAVVADHCTAILTRLISVASLSIVLPTRVPPTMVSSTLTIRDTCSALRVMVATSPCLAWQDLPSAMIRLLMLSPLHPRLQPSPLLARPVSRSARASDVIAALATLSSMIASAALAATLLRTASVNHRASMTKARA